MKELPKSYIPAEHEESVRQLWINSGFFNPDNLPLPADAPSYTIVLPPPNVTDRLHMGHAAMLALEDLMIRFHRMNGYRTLWLPGTDHAAIATQAVVEKKIFQEEKKTRHDLGREKFIDKIWEWKEQQFLVKLKILAHRWIGRDSRLRLMNRAKLLFEKCLLRCIIPVLFIVESE